MKNLFEFVVIMFLWFFEKAIRLVDKNYSIIIEGMD